MVKFYCLIFLISATIISAKINIKAKTSVRHKRSVQPSKWFGGFYNSFDPAHQRFKKSNLGSDLDKKSQTLADQSTVAESAQPQQPAHQTAAVENLNPAENHQASSMPVENSANSNTATTSINPNTVNKRFLFKNKSFYNRKGYFRKRDTPSYEVIFPAQWNHPAFLEHDNFGLPSYMQDVNKRAAPFGRDLFGNWGYYGSGGSNYWKRTDPGVEEELVAENSNKMPSFYVNYRRPQFNPNLLSVEAAHTALQKRSIYTKPSGVLDNLVLQSELANGLLNASKNHQNNPSASTMSAFNSLLGGNTELNEENYLDNMNHIINKIRQSPGQWD